MTLPQWAYSLKQDQLAELQAVYKRVEVCEEALAFYASPGHWEDREPYVSTPCIFKPKDSDGWGPKGERARQALNRGSAKE